MGLKNFINIKSLGYGGYLSERSESLEIVLIIWSMLKYMIV